MVDVCGVLSGSNSADKGAYWRKLKQRLVAEGSEVVTKCHGLKLIAADGKAKSYAARRSNMFYRDTLVISKWFSCSTCKTIDFSKFFE